MKACISTSLFLASICVIVYSLATKSLPLWFYISFSTLSGVSLVTLILFSSIRRVKPFIFFSIAILALVLWNFHAIATHYNLIAFSDSYQELVQLRLILDSGHVNIGARHPELGVGTGFSSEYPLFSILASSYALITNLSPLKVGVLLPSTYGALLLLSTFLFVRKSVTTSDLRSVAVSLAMLIFVVSPDMVYASTHFYHREFSLGLCFMLLYLLLKRFSGKVSVSSGFVLALLILILPLSHSAYPNIYTIFLLSLAAITMLAHILDKRLRILNVKGRVRPLLFPFVTIFVAGFLWNFMINYPSPVSNAFRGYVENLLRPRYEVGDIERFQVQAAPVIPEALRPTPWTILLPMRVALLIAPMFVVGGLLFYKLITGKIRDKAELLVLCAMVSVTIMITLDYVGGWYPLKFRIYSFPLIAYAAGVFYAFLARNARALKIVTSAIIVFVVVIAFLSPFWHIYYPRQLYDPAVRWEDVGFPNPSYIYFKSFSKNHVFSKGLILTDFKGLLVAMLPLKELERVRDVDTYYNESNTYVVEFIGLKPKVGYHSPEIVKTMNEIRSSINYVYCKLLDSGSYKIYFRH